MSEHLHISGQLDRRAHVQPYLSDERELHDNENNLLLPEPESCFYFLTGRKPRLSQDFFGEIERRPCDAEWNFVRLPWHFFFTESKMFPGRLFCFLLFVLYKFSYIGRFVLERKWKNFESGNFNIYLILKYFFIIWKIYISNRFKEIWNFEIIYWFVSNRERNFLSAKFHWI